jgi:hypothetical protein
MRYRTSCLEEYEDSVETCEECNQAVVTEEELSKRPEFRRLRDDDDPSTLVVVSPAEDPFEADAFVAAVDEAGIPVLARMRHGSSVDALTESINRSWWEILVPAEQQEKAAQAIAQRREELRSMAEDSEKAAEEEELETETSEKSA